MYNRLKKLSKKFNIDFGTHNFKRFEAHVEWAQLYKCINCGCTLHTYKPSYIREVSKKLGGLEKPDDYVFFKLATEKNGFGFHLNFEKDKNAAVEYSCNKINMLTACE